MYSVKVIFDSGRTIEEKAINIDWRANTLAIYITKTKAIYVSFYNAETIEIISED